MFKTWEHGTFNMRYLIIKISLVKNFGTFDDELLKYRNI